MFKTDNLSPMQIGRLDLALDKLYRYDGERVSSLRAELERQAQSGPLVKKEYDGTIDYNRIKFNRMDGREQAAYMARLKAKRYFTVNGSIVPKIVYDAIQAA